MTRGKACQEVRGEINEMSGNGFESKSWISYSVRVQKRQKMLSHRRHRRAHRAQVGLAQLPQMTVSARLLHAKHGVASLKENKLMAISMRVDENKLDREEEKGWRAGKREGNKANKDKTIT